MSTWTTFNFLIGDWHGTGSGQPGQGQYDRSYERVLNDMFISVRNKTTYPAQEQNPGGEAHEDWGIISYDKTRKTFVFRQFHGEGFVNQYILDSISDDSHTFVFVSESIENIPVGWRAKESYQVISQDEFIETFELAPPGKGFELYSTCHMFRK